MIYTYLRESAVTDTGVDLAIDLATSGGPAPHPYFFDGFVERADIAAAALLVVARVARTRFYTPPGMLAAVLRAADPVVTSDGAGLRFESLSACCGVYCRLDLLPTGLDRPPHARGTTNVDVNPPMRDALSGVAGLDPLHLAVGADELRVTTMDGAVIERRVPLPERWVRSFAEVHLIARSSAAGATYTPAAVRRFLQSQPRGRGALFAVPAPGGALRLASRPAPGGVGVAGPERLRALDPLLRHATRVRTYGPSAGDTGSAWLLDLPGARFTLQLSPSPSRAFSGEGGILTSDEAGHQGWDLVDAAPFDRHLPLDEAVQAADQPRMRAAEALVASGAVTRSGDTATVRGTDADYTVRDTPAGERCTCAWFATHALRRGPCKHILAVRLHRPA
ncbi:SWIM zinc finger family protein [Dactylosporangium sp. NPDC005572]|uniref:SWIM zinc finger family protein n=1 Tax=Dactylosporangium sp. NPDC005572 TaxID=3156889 RepID=UPI0033AEC8AF